MSLTLCDLTEYILQGSSLHWVFQTRILERVVISFPRGSPLPRDWALVSCSWQEYSSQLSHLGNLVVKDPTCQSRRHKRREFDPWVGKNPWRRAWQPTPVFLPGKFHGRGAWRTTDRGAAESCTHWSNLAHTDLSKVQSFLEQQPECNRCQHHLCPALLHLMQIQCPLCSFSLLSSMLKAVEETLIRKSNLFIRKMTFCISGLPCLKQRSTALGIISLTLPPNPLARYYFHFRDEKLAS